MTFTNVYGWAMPIAYPLSATARGHILGQANGCAMRRQGRCPGKQLCSDCAWNEGCLVDGTLALRQRRNP